MHRVITSLCTKRVDSPRPKVTIASCKDELSLDNYRKPSYNMIKMVKKSIDEHLKLYETQIDGFDTIRGPIPEIVILKNITDRYHSREDLFSEQDVELVINLIKLNKKERGNRGFELAHDVMFDSIIDTFKIHNFFERRVLFNLHSME